MNRRIEFIPTREIPDPLPAFIVIANEPKQSIFLLKIYGKMDCFGCCAASQ
jgi:hypothetical protein